MFRARIGPTLVQTTIDWPKRTGVIELVKFELASGRSQSSAPLAASTPTSFPCVMVTTWRTPLKSETIGEP